MKYRNMEDVLFLFVLWMHIHLYSLVIPPGQGQGPNLWWKTSEAHFFKHPGILESFWDSNLDQIEKSTLIFCTQSYIYATLKHLYLWSQSPSPYFVLLPLDQLASLTHCIFFSILLTHEGSHREVYRDFQPSSTSFAGGAKGWSDHRFRAPTAYTAQLLTLHQHRASNQCRMANQI